MFHFHLCMELGGHRWYGGIDMAIHQSSVVLWQHHEQIWLCECLLRCCLSWTTDWHDWQVCLTRQSCIGFHCWLHLMIANGLYDGIKLSLQGKMKNAHNVNVQVKTEWSWLSYALASICSGFSCTSCYSVCEMPRHLMEVFSSAKSNTIACPVV